MKRYRLLIMAMILAMCYSGYYKFQQSKITFQSPEGFSVEVDTDDITELGEKWIEAYVEQYRQKYIPRKQKVVEYLIEDIEIREPNVVQINFAIKTKKLDEEVSYNWNGFIDGDKIRAQWVLWFEEEKTGEGSLIYTATKLQRPAGYDLEKYQVSGEKERDEYEEEYRSEIPYKKEQYTYKIDDRKCYVSYDKGITWREVPISLEVLVSVGDGRPYYNQLQEGRYIISPEKTAFIHGGAMENPLTITYSEDMGNTWNSKEVSGTLYGTRLKFLSFPTANLGYVVATGERTMSQEAQVIYRTSDGGITWEEVGYEPSTWLLQAAGFIDQDIGFMSYPKVEGAETNFYRTEDGGRTFEPIILPVLEEEWMGHTFEPFIQPETPYIENGELFLLVGQGPQGDFKGGRLMAKLKSIDGGKTWTFLEYLEPLSQEIG